MEAVLPQVHIDLVRNHTAGRFRIGDEEYMLVRRAGKCDIGQCAHRAVRAVASRYPASRYSGDRAVRTFECRSDLIAVLYKTGKCRAPLHGYIPVAQPLAKNFLVIVLTENQDVWKPCRGLAGFTEGNATDVPARRPYVRAGGGFTKLYRSLGKAELVVDLERASLNAERSGFERWPRLTVNERNSNAAPAKLIRQHQSSRTRPDNQDVGIHRSLTACRHEF